MLMMMRLCLLLNWQPQLQFNWTELPPSKPPFSTTPPYSWETKRKEKRVKAKVRKKMAQQVHYRNSFHVPSFCLPCSTRSPFLLFLSFSLPFQPQAAIHWSWRTAQTTTAAYIYHWHKQTKKVWVSGNGVRVKMKVRKRVEGVRLESQVTSTITCAIQWAWPF